MMGNGEASGERGWALGVVVMGAAGCGKTTVGRALAEGLDWRFVDADDHHPPANLEKMRAGVALTDADRWPWLDALNGLLHEPGTAGEGMVLACSALRRAYRDRLRAGPRPLRWVYLKADAATLWQRLEGRAGHFFDPGLLASQLATLEEPDAGEQALTLELSRSSPELAVAARQWLEG